MAGSIFDNFENVIPNDAIYLLDPDSNSFDNNQQSLNGHTKTVPLDMLVPFREHPFTVNTDDDDFKELVQSIKDNGLISEIMVRPLGEKYEIISGHRRAAACKEVGLKEVPVIVKDLSDYMATVIMVHSNLYREKISYSEKAKAYRMIRDAEKHQGVKGTDTASQIGETHNDSKRQVYRYIRLSYLNDELLNLIDSGKMAFRSGVELGYLDDDSQDNLVDFIQQTKHYPSLDEASELKTVYLDEEKPLSFERIVSLVALPKEAKAEDTSLKEEKSKTKISFKVKEIADYFMPGTDPDYMESVILLLLKKYQDGEIEDIDL